MTYEGKPQMNCQSETGRRDRRTTHLMRASAAAMIAIASPTIAQDVTNAEASPVQQDDRQPDIIVTAQQAQEQVVSNGSIGVLGNKDALETPFNVTNYTAQLVLDQQSETLGDVLENEPSVRTTYGNGNQSELFVVRGFVLFGDDVAIDGLYGITPRQLVSPELYESIQVLNGANAFLFGAAPGGSGIGGSINLIPKRATRTLLRATGNFNADSIFGGNFDVGTRFGGDEAFGIRVNGVYRKGETAIDNEDREVRAASASFDFQKGPGRFFLDFGYEDQRAFWSRPIVRLAANVGVPDVPPAAQNYGQPWTFTKLQDIYLIGRAEIDLAEDVMAYTAAGVRDGLEDGDYSTFTVTNSETGDGRGSRLFVPRNDNNESGQAGVRGKFRTGGISHEANAGGSVNFQENRNAFAFGSFPASGRSACGAPATQFCTNLYDTPIVALPPNGFTSGSLTDPPRISNSEFTSLFISDTLGFIDDKVLVTVGARRQNIVVESFDRNSRLKTSGYNESATTPVVGVVVRPTERLSFYANRIEGLSQGPTAPNNPNTVNAGEIFPPFRSTQYEVGAKLAVRGLTATLAFYQTKQPNAFSQPTPTPTNPTLVTFVVDGEQRNRGIELSLNGEPNEFIRFIGGLAINDAKLSKTLNGANDGNEAVGVPDYQVNFGVEVVPPFFPNATLTGRIVHTGDQKVNVANTLELPSWTRFDLGIRYVVVASDHPITLRLSAENIDNRRYWYSAFGGYLYQGAPRTVKASVTFEY